MNRSFKGIFIKTQLFGLLAISCTFSGHTQENELEEDVLTLSPFEISTSGDVGYQATSTLAGTRIKTDLKDIGSAITVITQEFLRDTNANSNEELLIYTTNTEVGGIQGNFSGLGNAANLSEQSSLLKPHSNTRVRGLGTADNTRNFFLTDMPWDGYNIDRVDLQRGPNAILFGLGSPAGIINTSTTAADFYKNAGELELGYGSYGSQRVVGKYNAVILEDELAVRVHALYKDTKYQQKPAFNRDRRYYISARYEPKALKTKSSMTSIRFNYETGSITANRPRMLPPEDKITPWFTDMNQLTVHPMWAWNENANDPLNSNQAQRFTNSGTTNTTYDPWLGGYGNVLGGPIQIFDGANSQNPQAIARMPEYLTEFAIGTNGQIDQAIEELAFGRMLGVKSYSGYAIDNNLPFSGLGQYKNRLITDSSVFNYYDRLIDGPNKSEWADFEVYNITLTETFLDNKVGVEFSMDDQIYEDGQTQFANQGIGVDLNAYYIDESPNPNVGRAFIANNPNGGNYGSKSIRNSWRLTAFGEIDFREFLKEESKLAKILGRHVITGLYSKDKHENSSKNWVRWAYSDTYAAAVGIPHITSNGRQPNLISYISGSLLNTSSASGLNLPNLQTVMEPQSGEVYYFDSHYNFADSPDPADLWEDNWRVPDGSTQSERLANYEGWKIQKFNVLNASKGDINQLITEVRKARSEITSKAFIWQGYFLDGLLVGTYGYREDEAKSWSVSAPRFANNRADVNSSEYRYDIEPENLVKGSTHSYSLVMHSPDFIKDILPSGTDVSVFYNQSENFQPAASRVGVYGEGLDAPNGETKDYGIVVSLLNNRINLKVNWYETKVNNDTLTGGLGDKTYMLGEIETWGYIFAKIYQNNWGPDWQRQYSPWAGQTEEEAFAIQNAAVAAWLANDTDSVFADAWRIDRSDNAWQNRAGSYVAPNGLTATTDTVSKGVEYEFVAQITNDWSITMNASETTATRSNIGGNLRDYILERDKIFQGPAGDIRIWWGGSTDTVRSMWKQQLMSAYKLMTLQEGAEVPELRKWRFNLVSNYNFSDGALKGFNIGGSYRWQDKVVIGYPLMIDPETGDDTFDIENAYKGPTTNNIGMWIGYKRKLNNKIDWRIQLNVRNLFADDDLIPITTQPDGTPAGVRIPEDTVWTLTNTFSF